VPSPPPSPLPLVTTPVAPLRRVTVIGIDGVGPDLVRAGVASGRLPALARMAKEGAWGNLATLRPTEGPPIWTTIVTGRLPRDHGVKSFVRYRLAISSTEYELLPRGIFLGGLERAGLVEARPITHVARRRRALWNILNAFGIDVGVVRMWGTHPVERVRGFMLSNYFTVLPPNRLSEALHPPELAPLVAARMTSPGDIDPQLLSEFVDLESARNDTTVPWRRDLVERALAPDLSTLRATSILRKTLDPAFVLSYFHGMDVVGHTFYRYAFPDRFGNVTPEDVRRYGHVIERYAVFMDSIVGEALAKRRPHEVVLVVSGYGMQPVPVVRRIVTRLLGQEPRSGTHASGADGVLLMVGDGIRSGAAIRDASVLDVTPTILYLMGLPVARDMEGHVLTDVLDGSLARTYRVTYIPSYESLAVTPLAPTEEADLPPLPEGDR
jgi:predicted AlkP superfamily phosphohydrolase/phosphomutase